MKTLTFESGVSDHRKLIGTMLRSTFTKGKPKKMFYHCYRNFDNKKFEEELQKNYPQCQISNHFNLHLKSF